MILVLLGGCDLSAPARPGDPTEQFFAVPKGATASGLADKLVDAGVVDARWKWRWWLRSQDGTCVKAGRHPLRPDMTKAEVLTSLCAAPVPITEDFTVVEGWRIREIDGALAARGWIEAGAYATVASAPAALTGCKVPMPLPADTLEGYLYPETYRVEVEGFTAAAFICRQLETFAARFATPRAEALAASTRSLAELVVMASMIEREEPNPANRPLIAGILWKRLDSRWNLGVDATSRYTLADWNDRDAFMVKLRDPADPWNTRLRPGLPATPIGNPGVVALDAALAPVVSDYWYYLHDSTQTLHPSRSVAEHERFRKTYSVY